jgi:hypothetical protein
MIEAHFTALIPRHKSFCSNHDIAEVCGVMMDTYSRIVLFTFGIFRRCILPQVAVIHQSLTGDSGLSYILWVSASVVA